MAEDLTNLGNPENTRNDLEERNEPRVTPRSPAADADDLFDDTVQGAARDLEDDEEAREDLKRNPE